MAEPLAYSVGLWTTKSDQSDVFVKVWEDMANYVTKNSKGGIDFTLTQDEEQSNVFVSFGRWESADAFKIWLESSEFESYMNKMKPLCDDVKIRTMKGVFSIKGNIALTS
jgi:heme-degrading monooxygenase HmoA